MLLHASRCPTRSPRVSSPVARKNLDGKRTPASNCKGKFEPSCSAGPPSKFGMRQQFSRPSPGVRQFQTSARQLKPTFKRVRLESGQGRTLEFAEQFLDGKAGNRMELHISISGRVQGVGYRQWFRGRALTAGVSGWVRNCADGTVEAVLSGPAESVERLVFEARQGPSGADVEDIRRLEAAPPRLDGGGQTFFIAATDSFPRSGRDPAQSP